jgi:hypothetical protein
MFREWAWLATRGMRSLRRRCSAVVAATFLTLSTAYAVPSTYCHEFGDTGDPFPDLGQSMTTNAVLDVIRNYVQFPTARSYPNLYSVIGPSPQRYENHPQPGWTTTLTLETSPFQTSDPMFLDGHVWIVDFHNRKEVVTICQPSGSCSSSTTETIVRDLGPNGFEVRWLLYCAHRDPLPLHITLQGDRRSVSLKNPQPVRLTARPSFNGAILPYKPVTLRLETTPATATPGWLACGQAACSSSIRRTDSNGEFHFTYYPGSGNQPRTDTVIAECEDCSEPARWDIDVRHEVVIGFFNGVANTRKAAEASLYRLEVEFSPQHKGTPLKYDWFYNQTACGEGALGKLSCLEDVAEVFEQRSRELGGVFANRWESFWDILAGRHKQDTSFTGRLIGLLGDGSKALLMWADGAASAMLNQLTSGFLKLLTLFIDSPTYENQAAHLGRLTRYADEGSGLLLVAHSQGNLFVNSAVDALKAAKPDAQVQVVHVAPASPTLRGDYVLADIDLVINGLRLTGLNSVPDININLPASKIDPTGHSFEPTYLDTARAAYARTQGLIVQSLDALVN